MKVKLTETQLKNIQKFLRIVSEFKNKDWQIKDRSYWEKVDLDTYIRQSEAIYFELVTTNKVEISVTYLFFDDYLSIGVFDDGLAFNAVEFDFYVRGKGKTCSVSI